MAASGNYPCNIFSGFGVIVEVLPDALETIGNICILTSISFAIVDMK